MRRLCLILVSSALALTMASAAAAAAAPRIGLGPAISLDGKRAAGKARSQAPKKAATAGTGGAAASTPLFANSFDRPDGLITNEYAFWNPNSSQAVKSPNWEMTSGSLFAAGGAASTGVPDGCASASPTSSPCTASAVFRLKSARNDFGEVTVSTDLRVQRLVSTARTPAVAWDGVHVWLRYQSEESLYYASFARRDGRIVVKKKCPGGSENGGTYYELAPGEVSGFPIPFGAAQRIAASVANNPDGSVTITMARNGAQILTATDRGLGCAPITAPGAVGIRGDNAEFSFDDFTVN